MSIYPLPDLYCRQGTTKIYNKYISLQGKKGAICILQMAQAVNGWVGNYSSSA